MNEPIAIVVLRALAEYGGTIEAFGMEGVPPAQVGAALAELEGAGLIQGLQVTEEGRKLLEPLDDERRPRPDARDGRSTPCGRSERIRAPGPFIVKTYWRPIDCIGYLSHVH